jgi:hypothetical protein
MEDLLQTRDIIHDAAETLEMALRRLPVTKRAHLYHAVRDIHLVVAYADLVIDRALEQSGGTTMVEEVELDEVLHR